MRARVTALFALGALLSLASTAVAADAGVPDGGPVPIPVPVAIAENPVTTPPDAGAVDEATPDEPKLSPERMPSIELTVSPKEVAVGELVVWKLEIRRRVGDRAHLSSSASFGELEVQGKDDSVSDADDDWVRETLIVNLISFEAGEFEIPAQEITVVDIEGNLARLHTETVKIKVKSLIANEPEPQLKPDTGPGVKVYEEDYTLLYVLAVVGGVIVIALLTLLGRKLWSMRSPRKGPPPPPPRPAEEIALEKLNALKASSYLDEGRHKVFHVALSEAFREYLGNRYRFHSLDRSTEELVMELKVAGIERQLFNKVLNLLSETDLVKFAKFIPGLDDSRAMLDEAFTVVDLTTPKKQEPAAATSGAKAGADQEGGPDVR